VFSHISSEAQRKQFIIATSTCTSPYKFGFRASVDDVDK